MWLSQVNFRHRGNLSRHEKTCKATRTPANFNNMPPNQGGVMQDNGKAFLQLLCLGNGSRLHCPCFSYPVCHTCHSQATEPPVTWTAAPPWAVWSVYEVLPPVPCIITDWVHSRVNRVTPHRAMLVLPCQAELPWVSTPLVACPCPSI